MYFLKKIPLTNELCKLLPKGALIEIANLRQGCYTASLQSKGLDIGDKVPFIERLNSSALIFT